MKSSIGSSVYLVSDASWRNGIDGTMIPRLRNRAMVHLTAHLFDLIHYSLTSNYNSGIVEPSPDHSRRCVHVDRHILVCPAPPGRRRRRVPHSPAGHRALAHDGDLRNRSGPAACATGSAAGGCRPALCGPLTEAEMFRTQVAQRAQCGTSTR